MQARRPVAVFANGGRRIGSQGYRWDEERPSTANASGLPDRSQPSPSSSLADAHRAPPTLDAGPPLTLFHHFSGVKPTADAGLSRVAVAELRKPTFQAKLRLRATS